MSKKFAGYTIAELLELEAAATPGPWWGQYEYDGARTVCVMRSCDTTFCVNRASHVESLPHERTKENGAAIVAARNALRPLIEHIQLLTGAMAADDARDLAATNRLGLPPAGCDTPEVLADEIEALRARVADLQAYLASERGKA